MTGGGDVRMSASMEEPCWAVLVGNDKLLPVPVSVFPGNGYGVFDVGKDAAGRR